MDDPPQTTPPHVSPVAHIRPGSGSASRFGRAVMALTAASVAAMFWCAFCVADLRFLIYTEEWYSYLTDDQQQSVYQCMLRRITTVVGPLLVTLYQIGLLEWAPGAMGPKVAPGPHHWREKFGALPQKPGRRG